MAADREHNGIGMSGDAVVSYANGPVGLVGIGGWLPSAALETVVTASTAARRMPHLMLSVQAGDG